MFSKEFNQDDWYIKPIDDSKGCEHMAPVNVFCLSSIALLLPLYVKVSQAFKRLASSFLLRNRHILQNKQGVEEYHSQRQIYIYTSPS